MSIFWFNEGIYFWNNSQWVLWGVDERTTEFAVLFRQVLYIGRVGGEAGALGSFGVSMGGEIEKV